MLVYKSEYSTKHL